MGSCLSCRCRSASITFDTIRLVHLNGFVEDFNHPISVSEVVGKPPKQFLCTAAQLLLCSGSTSKPLNPDTELQPGHIYFVLPLSTLQDDISPVDMASLVKRLTAKAKSISSQPVPESAKSSASPSMGPQRRREISRRTRARSWKPILETIREISFTRRSESDLREMQIITKK